VKIKFIFMFLTLLSLFGQDMLRIHTLDGSYQDYQVNNISKLTFTDYADGESLWMFDMNRNNTVNDLANVDKLRFSDWYGYLAAPQNLAILADSSSVSLDWDPVLTAEDYLIFRSETDPYSGFAKIDSTSAVSYIDNDLLPGNKYFYHIVARNGLIIKR
jgi:hypothetical protein